MANTPVMDTTSTTLPLPIEPLSLPNATADTKHGRFTELPPVTTGTSERYIHGLASAVSRASVANPITLLFEGEKLPPGQSITDLDLPTIRKIIYEASLTRIHTKLAAGGFVVEAGNFAAVACWQPGSVGGTSLPASVLARRPSFAAFIQRTTELMSKHLYPLAERVSGGRFWKLSLMARDPGVEYVPGAVRAVLVPFIERFTSDHNNGGPMPVWLEAGSEQARVVYAHFGFRDMGEIQINGVKSWSMMYTGNMSIKD